MARCLRFPLAFALLLLAVGCAPRGTAPPVNVGYDTLRKPLSTTAAPLAGRRVLLDPGHGGRFRGVVGRDGFSEAEANLGVALYLRGLLEDAGATVFLTRTADRDFLSPADSSLAADLAHRSALCDSLRPDVFLSLHHNSNAALDRDMNETQTYYPAGREGADLDLARAIHTHLARTLGIEPAKIMPGNFSVLRNAPADVPAVLGEPSMLSNPHVEAKLKTAPKLELEAQAYFLGLREYFAGGTPRWRARGQEGTMWTFETGLGGTPLDLATVKLTVNGIAQEPVPDADGQTLRWHPDAAWDDRTVILSLTGRNLHGRATPSLLDTISIGDGVGQMMFRNYGDRYLAWRHTDAAGNLLPLPGEVRVGAESVPMTCIAVAGESHGVLPFISGKIGAEIHPDVDPNQNKVVRVQLQERPRRVRHIYGHHWLLLEGAGTAWYSRLMPRDLDPIDPLVVVADSLPVWLEQPGSLPLILPVGAKPDSVGWRPLFPHLQGRTIVIDPAGGGADSQGTGPLGTPGRELNLQVAQRLAALLRGAGMTVHLTRSGPGWVPPEEKVLLANRTSASLFLHLRRGDGPAPLLEHHVGSGDGERWARLTAAALGEAGLDGAGVGSSYAYLLRHTAPPALSCALPLPGTESAEAAARNPADQQALAWALFRSVDAYFAGTGLTPGWDPASFMARHHGAFPHPDDLDLLRVDGYGLWLPPRIDGPVALLPGTASKHILEVRSGERWWLWETAPEGAPPRRLLSGRGNVAVDPAADEPPRPKETDAPSEDARP